MSIRSIKESLGISDEAITNAVLNELGLSPGAAVKALADQLGVEYKEVSSFDLPSTNHEVPAPTTAIQNGDRVQTSQGEAVAIVIPGLDAATISKVAASIDALSL